MSISSLLINVILFSLIGWGIRRFNRFVQGLTVLIKAALVLGLIWLLLTSVGYLFTPLFFDHSEANIASVAANWMHGHLIYTALDSADRYSLLYGPLPYLVAAGFQALNGDAIFMSKLPGVLNLFCILLIFVWLISSVAVSRNKRLFAVGALALTLLGYYNISYWNRPDSYLLLFASLAFAVVVKREHFNKWFVYLIVGLLMGLAMNCKAHGVLYFVPIVVFYFETTRDKIFNVRLLGAVVCVMVGTLTPFLFPNIGGQQYLQWLEVASRHGIAYKDIVKNYSYVGCFLLFLLMVGVQKKYKYTYLALCLSSLLVAVAASKPGAGFHHFLPYMTMILYLAASEYLALSVEDQKRADLFVGAFIMTVAINSVNRQKRIVELLRETSLRQAEYADLKQIYHAIPGAVELGYSDRLSYNSSLYKVSLVKEGKGLLLDSASLMDAEMSGMSIPETTIDLVRSCKVGAFILPKQGQPWTMINFYDDKPLFGDAFRTAFNSSYELSRQTEYYSVYTCKHN